MYCPKQELDKHKRMADCFYPDCKECNNASCQVHMQHQTFTCIRKNICMPKNSISLLYPSQPNRRRGEQVMPSWKCNMPVQRSSQENCYSERLFDAEYIRTTLVRLLASSKRTKYTRQCLKQRFSAERRRILKGRRNSFTHDNNAAILDMDSKHPKDQRNCRTNWQASLEAVENRKWHQEYRSQHGIEAKWCQLIPNNNTERENNANMFHCLKEEQGDNYPRRFSITIIPNEKPSRIEKEGFKW